MKFALALFSSPHAPSSRRALRFAESLLAQGHEIIRVFLYQDAVHLASVLSVTAQDERDIPTAWQNFIAENKIDSVVCIAAALRRGVLDEVEARRYGRAVTNLASGWHLSGLGQFHEVAQEADRIICFGGD